MLLWHLYGRVLVTLIFSVIENACYSGICMAESAGNSDISTTENACYSDICVTASAGNSDI